MAVSNILRVEVETPACCSRSVLLGSGESVRTLAGFVLTRSGPAFDATSDTSRLTDLARFLTKCIPAAVPDVGRWGPPVSGGDSVWALAGAVPGRGVVRGPHLHCQFCVPCSLPCPLPHLLPCSLPCPLPCSSRSCPSESSNCPWRVGLSALNIAKISVSMALMVGCPLVR